MCFDCVYFRLNKAGRTLVSFESCSDFLPGFIFFGLILFCQGTVNGGVGVDRHEIFHKVQAGQVRRRLRKLEHEVGDSIIVQSFRQVPLCLTSTQLHGIMLPAFTEERVVTVRVQ